MSFYVTDVEIREHLENKVATQGERRLTYDDKLLLEILQECKVTRCGLCGAPVRHYVESDCAGHGEFPRYLKILCQNVKCGYTIRDCISYGVDWRDVEANYIEHCEKNEAVYSFKEFFDRLSRLENKIYQKGENQDDYSERL